MQHRTEALATAWHREPLFFAAACALLVISGFVSVNAIAAEAPRDGRIGYVLTERHWAIFETEDGAKECPQGFNLGPREQFSAQFPEDGVERTVVETRLLREGRQWHPRIVEEDSFTFHAAQGDQVEGLDLDGVVDDNDYHSPDGERSGIDNQMNRVLGCIAHYRTGGIIYHFENKFAQQYNDNRWIIELTGVDDLENDDEVSVSVYRGMDDLLTDAGGEAFIAGATQRVDTRWGRDYIEHTTGKIVDGVLTTQPIDTIQIPWSSTFDTSGYQVFRGLRMEINLGAEGAEGLLAGYTDVEAFNHQLNTTWSTHHQSYGQLSSLSQYHALRRYADGYPDPETGENTAISSAIEVKMTRVAVLHPEESHETVISRAEKSD
jgi:hypothetical protein